MGGGTCSERIRGIWPALALLACVSGCAHFDTMRRIHCAGRCGSCVDWSPRATTWRPLEFGCTESTLAAMETPFETEDGVRFDEPTAATPLRDVETSESAAPSQESMEVRPLPAPQMSDPPPVMSTPEMSEPAASEPLIPSETLPEALPSQPKALPAPELFQQPAVPIDPLDSPAADSAFEVERPDSEQRAFTVEQRDRPMTRKSWGPNESPVRTVSATVVYPEPEDAYFADNAGVVPAESVGRESGSTVDDSR